MPEMDEYADSIRDKILRTDFSSFIAKTFHTVKPGSEFKPNWHLDLIAEYLEACRNGEIKRLVINMPPRSLKSISISVAWPAWLLGHDPTTRIVCASYSLRLSLKHALDCRMVLHSPWFQRIFPSAEISDDQDTQNKVSTTSRGYRFTTSVGGTLTGEGGDVLIVDDPLHSMQAYSETYRMRANNWFDQSFVTRLDDRQRGVIVVVMQRLHENDLTGHILKKTGWQQLCLPLYAKKNTHFMLGDFSKEWREGELLQPNRYEKVDITLLQQELGSQAFSAQYMQEPVPRKGIGVELGWFARYDSLPSSGVLRVVQSWDTAFKTGGLNDPSVCLTFVETALGSYLTEAYVAKLEYPQLRKKIIEMAQCWQASAVLIEDKASGQSLVQDLRQTSTLPVISVTPQMDKQTRFYSVLPILEAGRLHLPAEAAWLAEFLRELMAFPYGEHDDQVDALSQYLQWSSQAYYLHRPQIRRI